MATKEQVENFLKRLKEKIKVFDIIRLSTEHYD